MRGLGTPRPIPSVRQRPGGVSLDGDETAERLLFDDGAWIGHVDLVPVVIASGEEAVIPQLCETVAQ